MAYFGGDFDDRSVGDNSATPSAVSLAEQVRIDAVFNRFREKILNVFGSPAQIEEYKESADTLFDLAKQLPANKILEPKTTKHKWTYFHFACRNKPHHALEIIDKFTPEQLYMRVDDSPSNKEQSPIRLALGFAGESNSFDGENLIKEIIKRARPEDLLSRDGNGRTDLRNILGAGRIQSSFKVTAIEMIIKRARPQDLASIDNDSKTDLEYIQRSNLPDENKKILEKLYLKRLGASPSVLAVVAAKDPDNNVIKIIDPNMAVQALIANPDANELDAVRVSQDLDAAFQTAVDKVAKLAVSNHDTAFQATQAVSLLLDRISVVQNCLDELSAEPDKITVGSGIVGTFTKLVRKLIPSLDPIHPALVTLDSARVLATQATQSAQDMINVQIGIADNQAQLQQPFELREKALETAIAHYVTVDTAVGKRMHSVFLSAADNNAAHMNLLQRLGANTDAARDCATGVILTMNNIHTELNGLAVSIAELATRLTQRELDRAYRGDGAITVTGQIQESVRQFKLRLQAPQETLLSIEAGLKDVVIVGSIDEKVAETALSPVP